MAKKFAALVALLALLGLLVTGCDLTPQEQAQLAATAQSLSPSQIAGLAATVEAAPPEQIAALQELAGQSGAPPLTADQQAAVRSTVTAARATATAVGVAASQGERVNATEVPGQAPVIPYFFAAVPSQAGIEAGIMFVLNYTTQNANRVEIFGNVMPDPAEGSFPIYDTDSPNWVLWAANDVAWVERTLTVAHDADTGSALQNVTVSGPSVTFTLRDPQLQDGDVVNIDVNGVRVLDRYPMTGRHVSFPVQLTGGDNTVVLTAQNPGVSGPLVAELTISDVTTGPAVQVTKGLARDESETITIAVPAG